MSDSRRPDPHLMNRFAVDVLEAASDAADEQPIERTSAHRLALAWLVLNGIAKSWQTQEFWDLLGTDKVCPGPHAHYIRSTRLVGLIGAWRKAAGMPADTATAKGERVDLARQNR